MTRLSCRTATNDTAVVQDSNQWHGCRAGQQPVTRLSCRTATSDTAVMQDSNQWHGCHAGQQPMTRLSCRTTTTTRFSLRAAKNRQRQNIASIRSGGLLPCKHSPDGAKAHIRLNGPATHLSTSDKDLKNNHQKTKQPVHNDPVNLKNCAGLCRSLFNCLTRTVQSLWNTT